MSGSRRPKPTLLWLVSAPSTPARPAHRTRSTQPRPMPAPSRRAVACSTLASWLLLLAGLGGASAETVVAGGKGARLWRRQLGTGSVDAAYAVSADGRGSVYVAGTTEGSLGGANAGDADAFLSRFASDGRALWTRQL